MISYDAEVQNSRTCTCDPRASRGLGLIDGTEHRDHLGFYSLEFRGSGSRV